MNQEKILKTENLRKSYESGQPVLKDISFTLERGEVVVVVGPSGCGKSTFLRCLNMLEPIDSGTIQFKDRLVDRSKRDVYEIRQKIGMVFQSYDLFPHKTILGNILLAPLKVQKRDKREVTEEAQQLLSRVGLLEKRDSFPRQLSGGQKQRVAIVRALIMHPEILLLDTFHYEAL